MLGSRRAYHLVRRWTVLTCIWMERQAAIRGREPGDQLKYLGDYNRFLRRLELVDAVIMTAVGASVVGALITYSEPLGGPILLVFVPILWGLAVLVPGRFMKLYHRIKVSSSVGRNISTFQDFKYSITNEMVSRMATDARDRVHGIRGLLDPEAQAVLNHTSATSAPQLFQDYFETVATTDTLACRLIFCASGPLCEGGPSWVPDLERAHKAWTQPQSVFWNAQYQFQEDFIPADGPQEKFVPVLSISDDHRRLTVDRIDVGKVLWVGEAFRAPPAAVEMLLSEDGGFSAAHLHNLRQLCEPLLRRRSDSDNNTKLSTSEWPQLAYVLLKRHEMTDLSLIEAKLTKWIKVVRKWRTEEDSAAVLAGLRDGQLLKFHDAICNNLEASKRRLFVCQARDKLRLGNGPEGLQPDDDVVGITHYGADSLLAVRHGPQDACSRLVGSLELEGDWWRRADLERETFTPLVLE
ncbi:hypothetical protein B0T26DRAFT_429657 [Lasiosphaeria miniovina]|uniref:Uncharacterized protein n=1 Tax=Lasiosphaeria miniovina TaxID=1954250 RepID=A0AA40A689_9PEZI|nr:uncharacterized protein B0T26DRAFT_429657 [Lasiosphaeria miniovina]KAK0709975.1 hypothetical protein B0T26DRAFT_429657 [Lasiosphaeria miniovina]